MSGIPGWDNLWPVEPLGKPSPFPGSISDFDKRISEYDNALADARSQIQRNGDAEAMEKRHIREHQQYIARQNRMIAECNRKGHKVPPETAGNIADAQELIADSQKVLSLLPAHKAEWIAERDKRQKWVTYLRQERAKGIGKNGEARKCGSKTQEGPPCQNEKHYREGSGWGPCTIQGH